jgi:hypothetical protein
MNQNARPFRGTEALSAGLVTRRTLRSRHRRLFRNVYIGADVPLTALAAAEAAWLFSDRKATLAGGCRLRPCTVTNGWTAECRRS